MILSSYPALAELKDLVKQWRKEGEKNPVYLAMISEKDNLQHLPEFDLAYNVLQNVSILTILYIKSLERPSYTPFVVNDIYIFFVGTCFRVFGEASITCLVKRLRKHVVVLPFSVDE